MRKNPTPKEQLNDDLKALGLSFSLYLLSYWLGYQSLCIMSIATMNLITFQVGITFHEVYSKPIHLNQFDELDSSTTSENSVENECSLKQREQGGTRSTCMTEEQEEKVRSQLREIVNEATLRNRKNNTIHTGRTPSSSTLVEEGEISPMPPLVTEEEYRDMPHLVPAEIPICCSWNYTSTYSQNHYLHGIDMDEVD